MFLISIINNILPIYDLLELTANFKCLLNVKAVGGFVIKLVNNFVGLTSLILALIIPIFVHGELSSRVKLTLPLPLSKVSYVTKKINMTASPLSCVVNEEMLMMCCRNLNHV